MLPKTVHTACGTIDQNEIQPLRSARAPTLSNVNALKDEIKNLKAYQSKIQKFFDKRDRRIQKDIFKKIKSHMLSNRSLNSLSNKFCETKLLKMTFEIFVDTINHQALDQELESRIEATKKQYVFMRKVGVIRELKKYRRKRIDTRARYQQIQDYRSHLIAQRALIHLNLYAKSKQHKLALN